MVQYFAKTPIAVCLYIAQLLLSDILEPLGQSKCVQVNFNIVVEKHNKKRCDNVIDTLDITTCRVSHMPNIKNSSLEIYYFLISFWMFSWRINWLSGRVLFTSSIISLNIFCYWASLSNVGFVIYVSTIEK